MIAVFSEYGDRWWYVEYAVIMFGGCVVVALLAGKLVKSSQDQELRRTILTGAVGATLIAFLLYGHYWLTEDNRALALFEDGICHYDKDHSSRFVNWRQIARLEQKSPANRRNPERHTYIEIRPEACHSSECILNFHVPVRIDVFAALSREARNAQARGGAIRQLSCPPLGNIR